MYDRRILYFILSILFSAALKLRCVKKKCDLCDEQMNEYIY